MIHHKLVRDGVPDMLARRGIPHEIGIAEHEDLPAPVNARLEEESAEYLAVTDNDTRIDESADLLEPILRHWQALRC